MAKFVCEQCGETFTKSTRGRKPKVLLCPKCKEAATKSKKAPAATLVCSICSTEFEYTKRGRRPVHPVCPVCAEKQKQDKELLMESKKNRTKDSQAPVQEHFTVYVPIFPTLKEKEPEPGEKLYFVPTKIFPNKRGQYLYGRVVRFVEVVDGKALVEVTRRRNNKTVTEKLTTVLENLTRFKRVSAVGDDQVNEILAKI